MAAAGDSKTAAAEKPTEAVEAPVKATVVGEDDEFEDFPADDWPQEESEAAGGSTATQHLWEESWDDDDTSDDFSVQLKEELKKVEAAKKR
ncbi:DSS1/SEM1 family protein [Ceratocystis lukuohia]|uniref:26S proteasome complex subunit SEM1 n=1 Tax=Ceratocystis lukuohia TaxID=2019550 RepID=A0ABR4MHF2_9PEZI